MNETIIGFAVVLPLFLRNSLGFSDETSTSIYHGFTIFGYISAIFGAAFADSWLGKFRYYFFKTLKPIYLSLSTLLKMCSRTVIYFSVLYLMGGFLLTFSATPILADRNNLM